MGCQSGKTYIENSINEMWVKTTINSLSSSEYISNYEKAIAYKKELNNQESFDVNILDKVLKSNNSLNEEIEYIKKTFLIVKGDKSNNSFEIPFALLFLTKSNDYLELHKNFTNLILLLDDRLKNPKKIKENIKSLKIILEFYLSLISIFSLEAVSTITGCKGTDIHNQFIKIYSVEIIKKYLDKIFYFEKCDEIPVCLDDQYDKYKENIILIDKQEIFLFFKNNFNNFNPTHIRDRLFEWEIVGINDDLEIKRILEEKNISMIKNKDLNGKNIIKKRVNKIKNLDLKKYASDINLFYEEHKKTN